MRQKVKVNMIVAQYPHSSKLHSGYKLPTAGNKMCGYKEDKLKTFHSEMKNKPELGEKSPIMERSPANQSPN